MPTTAPTTTAVELKRLEVEAKALHEKFTALADKFQQAAQQLRDPGRRPTRDLFEDSAALNDRFKKLREQLLNAAQTLKLVPQPELAKLDTVAALHMLAATLVKWQADQTRFEAIAAKLSPLFDRAETLSYSGEGQLPALVEFRVALARLRGMALGARLDEAARQLREQLEAGAHPLNALLKLVSDPALSDEQAMPLFEQVKHDFGPALAMAAARGKLRLEPIRPLGTSRSPAAAPISQPPEFNPVSPAHVTGAVKAPESRPAGATSAMPISQPPESKPVVPTPVAGAVKAPDPRPAGATPAMPISQPPESKPVAPAPAAGAVKAPDPQPVAAIPIVPISQPPESKLVASAPAAGAVKAPDPQPVAAIPTVPISQPPESDPGAGEPAVTRITTAPLAEAEAALPLPSEPETELEPADTPFTTHDRPSLIARRLLRREPPNRLAAAPELVWALIRDDQLGLAYWLTRALEREALPQSSLPLPPARLIEALALSEVIRNDIGPGAPQLRDLMASPELAKPADGSADDSFALDLLLTGCALRPSLLAPHIGTAILLNRPLSLPEGVGQLRRLIAAFAERGQRLMPEAMRGFTDQASWQKELDHHMVEVKQWWTQAQAVKIVYAPATGVWRTWLKPDGWLYTLLKPVLANQASQIDVVREQARAMRNDAILRRLILRTDRQQRGSGPLIQARAITGLLSHANEAIDLTMRWIELHEQAPAERGWQTANVQQLHDGIADCWRKALIDLEQIAREAEDDWPTAAACAACARNIRAIHDLLEGTSTLGQREPERSDLLSLDLLKISTISLTPDWEPTEASWSSLCAGLLRLIANPPTDWESVYRLQRERRNHEATLRVIEQIERGSDHVRAEALRLDRQRALEECRAALRRDLTETKIKIEDAVLNDILAEHDRTRLIEVVEKISAEDVLDFQAVHMRLRKVRDEVAAKRAERAARSRARVDSLRLSDQTRQRILAALERGDISTADEYIAQAERSLPLIPPRHSGLDVFAAYFPRLLNDLDREMEQAPSPAAIIESVRERRLRSIDLSTFPRPQMIDAADALRAWYDMKRNRLINADWLRWAGDVLSWLGFAPTSVEPQHTLGRDQWFQFTANLPHPLRVPPVFGSATHGQYQVLCVWDRRDEEQLLEAAGHGALGRATIVFLFGRMVEKKRRELAKRIRSAAGTNRPVLVIDDILLLYLVGERGSRLATLFACSLPFTFVNPYTPSAAGNVPREMFYGRELEAGDLQDPYGPGFIFGGRQLGKSALLKHVQRQFHQPEHGLYALYFDLKSEGIGEQLGADDIWNVLARDFTAHDIIPDNMPKHAGLEVLLSHVMSWLQADKSRRILLLLDEADKFLDYDAADDFKRVSRLKGLMTDSDRRFKLIFAGLHNVQRFIRHVNQPLAHLGRPISVGPLEPRAAEELVVSPLHALGYRFGSPDLVIRILSHTNFHPSLIQLFCDELLRHLRETMFDWRTSPPYVITEKHIEDAYRSQNLRDRIRERFEWTLNLDARYRVIAYSIAYESLLDPEASQAGFTINEVGVEARRWWPTGFADSASTDDIRGLLEEMIGLGILINSDGEHYRLRSPNVLRLLGTQTQIEQRLLEAETWQPPAPFNADDFRRPLDTSSFLRSPFTGAQESDLLKAENGVRLIFGHEALGLDAVPEALRRALGNEESSSMVISPERVLEDAEQFRVWLHDLLDSKQAGRVLLLIPVAKLLGTVPPLAELVTTAQQLVRRRYAANRSTRVIFMFDPTVLPAWFAQSSKARVELESSGQQVTLLKRWNDASLRRWLDDIGIVPNDAAQRSRILQSTGGWPVMLYRFAQLVFDDHQPWEVALAKLDVLWRSPGEGDALRKQFGLTAWPQAQTVIQVLREIDEPLTVDELAALIDGSRTEQLIEVLEGLQRLCFVMVDRDGRVSQEPLSALLYRAK